MAVVEQQPAQQSPPWTEVLHEWVTTVDHKKIGVMYILMALFFLVVGGVMALVMRSQLWTANTAIVGPDVFNQMMTMHGTTMIFFVAMPILAGVANYIVPLQIGARDMAFPRLNALGLWATLFGALLCYYSFATGGAPAIGWFAYAPLTEKTFARSAATDFWVLGLLVAGVGTLSGAVNVITTVLTLRCPGMTLRKVPLYTWMAFWANVQMLAAIPPLTAALIMVFFDRNLGANFFNAQNGGSPYLWQHLFWFFGHPEVYILVLPAFGMVSETIPVFSRKVIFGYEFVAASTVAIAFISFGVWAHHMFAVGMSRTVDVYFVVASLLVAIPTGVKMFNWLATLYGGKLRLTVPMLFALGFLSMFVIGGLTGVMLALAPVDFQLTDTYFVVGHFHWVIIGGILMGLFSGLYYWYPKVTGRMMSERLGRWQFWLLLIGFLLTFGPMHIAGIVGMPRRIFTYPADRGWDIWNQISTVGAFIQAPSYLIFVYNAVVSLWRGRPAGDDPWDAWTLEWATTSPPPSYNFETTPTVLSRRPLWDQKHPDDPDWLYEDPHKDVRELVPGGPRPHSLTPKVGMLIFLVTEVAFFSTLIMTYAIFLRETAHGTPSPRQVFELPLVLISSLCLFSSSATVHLAEKALHRGSRQGFLFWWGTTIALGILFLLGTGREWAALIGEHGLTISRNMFGTTYFTLVGFHAAHVTVGVTVMSILFLLAWRGHITARNPTGVTVVSWYWHFVDGVWVVVFTLVYLIGR